SFTNIRDPDTKLYLIDGQAGLQPGFLRIRNLGRMLQNLRDLRTERSTSAQDAYQFASNWQSPPKNVSIHDFTERLISWVRQHQRSSDFLREFNKDFGNSLNWVEAINLALDSIKEVMASPQYQQQLNAGSQTTDIEVQNRLRWDADRGSTIVERPGGGTPFEFSAEPGPEVDQRNRAIVDEAIQTIDDWLNDPDNKDSVDRFTWQKIREVLENERGDPTYGTLEEEIGGRKVRRVMRRITTVPTAFLQLLSGRYVVGELGG